MKETSDVVEAAKAAAVEAVVEDLFTSGDGFKATRLVLTDDIAYLGGWGRKPIADKLSELFDAGLRHAGDLSMVLAYEAGQGEARHAGEWVSVSERLPDKHETYPVTIDNGHGRWVEYLTFNIKYSDKAVRQWMTFYNQEWVVAWQEMPAPYNPKEDE